MARLTKEQWRCAQNDYEVHGLGIRQVARKYGVSPASVSTRAKKEQWEQGKAEHIIERKKNAIKELAKTEQQTKHCSPSVQISINNEVQERLQAEGLFVSSALFNQKLANMIIENKVDDDGNPLDLEISQLESHCRITARNKETVLGKNPDTAVQVNNETRPQIVINRPNGD